MFIGCLCMAKDWGMTLVLCTPPYLMLPLVIQVALSALLTSTPPVSGLRSLAPHNAPHIGPSMLEIKTPNNRGIVEYFTDK